MELEFNVEELIDLSFLTDEEMDVIVQVLYRDTELRLLEDQRIKKLQQSVFDPEQLKIATGDWFKEVRAKRHTDKQFGSDIVRASIRKKKRTKGERQKRVTINDEKTNINEQRDQDPEQQENVNCAITNEDTVSPEQESTGMDEPDCEQSEIHKRLVDNKNNVTSKQELLTLHANTQTQQNDNTTPQTKDDEMLRTEEGSISVPDIQVQSKGNLGEIENPNPQKLILSNRYYVFTTCNEKDKDCCKYGQNADHDILEQESVQRREETNHDMVAVVDLIIRGIDSILYKQNQESHNNHNVIEINTVFDREKRKTATKILDFESVYIPKRQELYLAIKTAMDNKRDVDVNNSLSNFLSPALSGSMMSLYSSADFGCVDVRGSITFSLHYDENSHEFHILLLQCDDLAGAKKNRSDPYVKSYLLPDKSSRSKRKTSVRKKTLNPTFNERLMYKLEKDELQSRTLNLSVWHSDHFGHNLFLGEVEIPLESWDWSNIKPISCILQPRIAPPPNMIRSKGQLSLSLKFIPAGSQDRDMPPTAEVHIWLKEARNLIPIRSKGINPFVKCYILPDVTKSSRQKTRVIKKDLNPVYNHTMVYDGFQTEDMSETCAEITIWDHDTFSSQLLGGLRLSLGTGLSYGQPASWMDSNEEEISAWRRMLSGPGQWVDSVIPLRPNINPME
ncbi:synaptotagmin-like protein 1 [Heterodontus francisci]|uniref:synaptotagmin-like protein 1 n=1 Tax=Heterodontus francisci TaxID=7792 RepID=UPI00355B1693